MNKSSPSLNPCRLFTSAISCAKFQSWIICCVKKHNLLFVLNWHLLTSSSSSHGEETANNCPGPRSPLMPVIALPPPGPAVLLIIRVAPLWTFPVLSLQNGRTRSSLSNPETLLLSSNGQLWACNLNQKLFFECVLAAKKGQQNVGHQREEY